MTFEIIRLLQAFSNDICRTIVQHLTTFQLTLSIARSEPPLMCLQ